MWLTAGARLLLATRTSHSRPDFLVGLGLLAGGALIGLTTWPLAGLGAFPVEAIVIGATLFWALYGDEANALQRGDCWAPVLTIGAGTLLLHGIFSITGPQPVLNLAIVKLRPFELPALGLLFYVWSRRLNRVEDSHRAGFTHLERTHLRNILWATAAASFASMVTGSAGDTFRFLLLVLAPASFLRDDLEHNRTELARIAAVAAVCSLGFIGLDRADQIQNQRAWLQLTMRDAGAVNNHYIALQRQVDQAVETWAHTTPERIYTERHQNLVTNLKQLHKASGSVAPQLRNDCKDLDEVLTAHNKASRELFEAVAMRSAQWGDEKATSRAEARARAALKEARSTHERGMALIRSIEKHLAGRLASFGNDIEALSTTVLSLLLGGLLIGLALLITPVRHESPAAASAAVFAAAATDTDIDDTIADPEPAPASEPDPARAPDPDPGPAPTRPKQANAEFERLAKVMLELSEYCEEEPVAAAAYDCIQVLKEAARGLPNEQLLETATELEHVLKSGGERARISAATEQLSKVCWSLGAPENA